MYGIERFEGRRCRRTVVAHLVERLGVKQQHVGIAQQDLVVAVLERRRVARVEKLLHQIELHVGDLLVFDQRPAGVVLAVKGFQNGALARVVRQVRDREPGSVSFVDHRLVEADGEDHLAVHLVVHIEDIGHILQQGVFPDHLFQDIGGLLRPLERQVDLAQQRPGRTERRTTRIGPVVALRKHRLVDDLLQVAGNQVEHLLLGRAPDPERLLDRHNPPRRGNAAPEPVFHEVGIGPQEHRLALVLGFEPLVEIGPVDAVEHHVAAVDRIVEIGPGIFENAVRGVVAELVDVVAVLRAGRRGIEVEIVAAVLAQLRIVVHLGLEFGITAHHGDVEIARRLVDVVDGHFVVRREVEERLAARTQAEQRNDCAENPYLFHLSCRIRR